MYLLMDKKCSILSKSSNKKKTCLTREQVVSLAKLYNNCSPYNKCYSNSSGKKISTSGTKEEVLKSLKKALKIKEEQDINKFDFVNGDPLMYYSLKTSIYKKILPKREGGWLYTTDINGVMKQYSQKYNFNYLGALPSDYYELNKFSETKRPCYIIFNTDPSFKPGEHWVSMVINGDNTVHYFDSNGMRPTKRLYKFMKDNGLKLTWFNREPYQNKDGLCGAYAMHYLIQKAKGKPLGLNKKADNVIEKQEDTFFYKA